MTTTEPDTIIDVDPKNEDEEPMALVPVEPVTALVRPAGTPADVADAFAEYASVCEKVLDDGDYQRIGDKRFRTKSAWRKLAVAYGVNLALVEERTERTEDGLLLRVHCTVRATAPNGRFADGLGTCAVAERSFSHVEHDVRGTAYTRAANRACADLFGLGEVSAEEVDSQASDWPLPETMRDIRRKAGLLSRLTIEVVGEGEGYETILTDAFHWPSNILGLRVFDPDTKEPRITSQAGHVLVAALDALMDLFVVEDDVEEATAFADAPNQS